MNSPISANAEKDEGAAGVFQSQFNASRHSGNYYAHQIFLALFIQLTSPSPSGGNRIGAVSSMNDDADAQLEKLLYLPSFDKISKRSLDVLSQVFVEYLLELCHRCISSYENGLAQNFFSVRHLFKYEFSNSSVEINELRDYVRLWKNKSNENSLRNSSMKILRRALDMNTSENNFISTSFIEDSEHMYDANDIDIALHNLYWLPKKPESFT